MRGTVFAFLGVALIEIALKSYVYRFRRLSWREEIDAPTNRVLLAEALHDVSGLEVRSREDALRILGALPIAVLDRVWVVYKASLPAARHYRTAGLYKAPDAKAYAERQAAGEREADADADKAFKELASRFGLREAAEAREQGRAIYRDLRKRGALVMPTPESPAPESGG